MSEEKWKIPEVAKAIGRSEDAIRYYCETKGIDPDEGLAIEEILYVSQHRSPCAYMIDWIALHRLEEKLSETKSLIMADFSGEPL